MSSSIKLTQKHTQTPISGSPSLSAGGDFLSVQQLIEVSVPQTISITIFDDSFTEANETFGASLSNPSVLVGGTPRSLSDQEAARVIVQPATASVEILDNDGKYLLVIVSLRLNNYPCYLYYNSRDYNWIPTASVCQFRKCRSHKLHVWSPLRTTSDQCSYQLPYQ